MRNCQLLTLFLTRTPQSRTAAMYCPSQYAVRNTQDPIRSSKHTRSKAISEDLATTADSQSSYIFTNLDTDESNPLYAPDLHLARVRQLMDNMQHRQEADLDLMGAITFTFNLEHRDRVFPVRIEEIQPMTNSTQPSHYRL